ncbi:transcription termination factor MTEF1, chloroplastic-like [Wolffia australiana]
MALTPPNSLPPHSLPLLSKTHQPPSSLPTPHHLLNARFTPTAALHHPPPKPTSPSSPNPGLLFRQKLLYLEETLGIDSSEALSRNPHLRSFPLSSLHSLAAFLSSMGLPSTHSGAGRVLSRHPELLTCDPQTHLLPVFRFLLGPVGLPRKDLPLAVLRCPRLLVSSVDSQLRPALLFLRQLGFVGNHRISCRTTLLLVSSVEGTLIPKLEYIQNLGFSRREAAKMVLRSPGLFTFSIERNFRPKVAYLVEDMRREIAELKDFPQYFSFSLEGKIKPRHRRLVENGFGDMPLADMLKVSDGEFNDRLVEMRLRLLDERL